jgi:hypothetical protein
MMFCRGCCDCFFVVLTFDCDDDDDDDVPKGEVVFRDSWVARRIAYEQRR